MEFVTKKPPKRTRTALENRYPRLKNKCWIYVGNWQWSGPQFRIPLIVRSDVEINMDVIKDGGVYPLSGFDPVMQVVLDRVTWNNKELMVSEPMFGHLVYWGWSRGKD